MRFTRRSKAIISLILAMLFIPLGVLVEEVVGYLSSMRTYHTAVALFEQGGLENHQQALPIFRQLGGLEDASLYALYIEGETHLVEGDLLAASQIFQAVSGNDFLDSANLFDYVMARRAEDADRPRDAMILYHRAAIRDANARFDALQAANPTIDLTKDEIPANAKVSGFAFVYANNIRPVSTPGAAPEPTPTPTATAKKSTAPAQEPPLTFAQFDVVRLLGFDWDASGKLWARVAEAPDTADEAPGDSVGWLAMSDLLPMTPADEANYIAVLEAAPPPPTDHYARLTTNSVNVRPEPKKNGSNGTVGKTDIVQIFDTVIGEDGTQWRKIMTASGAEGFVPEQYLILLTESEEIAHRASMGVTSPPKPAVTPMPAPIVVAVDVLPEVVRSRLPLPTTLDSVTGMDDQYDLALWLLSVGFTTYEPIPALEKAIALFERLGDYKNAAAYVKLARFLLLIEQGKSEEAEALLAELYEEGFFDAENLARTQDEIPIPTVDELYVYLIARKDAKTAEEIEYAIALLDGLNVLDSAARMISLSQRLAEGPSIKMAVEGVRPRDTVNAPALNVEPILIELAALCASGSYEAAFSIMQSAEFAGVAERIQTTGHPYIVNTVYGKIGIYPVVSEKYGSTMVYFGGYIGDARNGSGVWLGYSDGNNYIAECEWQADTPNGYARIREWNDLLNEQVVYRIIEGNVVDGLWHGAVNWIFDRGGELRVHPVTFTNGYWVVLRVIEPDEHSPETEYVVSEATGDGSGIMAVWDPFCTQGIVGYSGE